MNEIQREIEAFQKMQEDLEKDHMSKWVVIHDQKLIVVRESFNEAASEAVRLYGRGPYLIKQVGAQEVTLPASVMYNPVYA